MDSSLFSSHRSRLGFHYFADSQHYRQRDLQTWLPRLQELGISWLTLLADPQRAIPEFFIRSLVAEGIEPLVRLVLQPEQAPAMEGMQPILESYTRWGVRYLAPFDRPNLRSSWSATGWSQGELIEHFLDLYLPAANIIQQAGLQPIFPALEPGGDYWDLAFLRLSLQGLVRRRATSLLENFVLGMYAWAGNRPLDWGAGGPERWPAARPYNHSPETQDQLGFRVFDWYLPMLEAELGNAAQLLILGAGSRGGDLEDPNFPFLAEADHARRNLSLVRWVEGELSAPEAPAQDFLASHPAGTSTLDPLPAQVLACNMWLLAADEDSPYAGQAWYNPDGSPRLSAQNILAWRQARQAVQPAQAKGSWGGAKFISHYLLLPVYAWGAGDWDLEALKPWLQRGRVTVGFSVEEARLAERVTILDAVGAIPESVLEKLRAAGCKVERTDQTLFPA